MLNGSAVFPVRRLVLALFLGSVCAGSPFYAQANRTSPGQQAQPQPMGPQPMSPQQTPAKPEEKIVVTQTPQIGNDEAKARTLLQQMVAAIGGDRRMQRLDYRLDGRTSTFFKNQPTGSTEYVLFHHALAGSGFEDRIELTKKRDIVQIWTPTEGYEVTYKGRKDLPKEDRDAYFRRQTYSLDSLVTVWIADPQALISYEGQKLVSRRQAHIVSIINAKNEKLEIAIEVETSLPIRRSFQTRNEKYKDFDEDVEEYSDWHTQGGVPVPFATTRYFNGDMVSERFVTKIEFQPVDVALFSATARLGKHR